jgi:hypothetical protein
MSNRLTDNQRALLQSAARREDRCFVLPSNLKGGAAQKVAAKLIAEGFAREIKAKVEAPVWRRDSDSGQDYALKATAAGVKAVASDGEPETAVERREHSLPSPTPAAPMEIAANASEATKPANTEPRTGSAGGSL